VLENRELIVVDPRTGELVGRTPVASGERCVEAVRAARQVAAGWSRTPAAERGAALHAAADAVSVAAAELAELTGRETGKPLDDTRGGIEAGIATLRQYAELGPLHRGRSLNGSWDATDLMVHEPRGVVVALTPWNDPVAVAAGLIGAALDTATPSSTSRASAARRPGAGRRARGFGAPGRRAGDRRRGRRCRRAARRVTRRRRGARGQHRDGPVHQGGVRPQRCEAASGERRKRPADRRRRRRPGVGGRAGGARGVRQRRADLRVGGTDLPARGDRRPVPRGARPRGRGMVRPDRSAGGPGAPHARPRAVAGALEGGARARRRWCT
jgi:hypothetical protein